MFRRYVTPFLVVCFSMLVLGVSQVSAMTAVPGWEIIGRSLPTNLSPSLPSSTEQEVRFYVFNMGGAPAKTGAEAGTFTVTLPEGLTAEGKLNKGSRGEGPNVEDAYGSQHGPCEGTGTRVVTCKLERPDGVAVRPLEDLLVRIPVVVDKAASGTGVSRATAVGGGAKEPAETSLPLHFSDAPVGLGFSAFDTWLTNADGTTDTQAGSHPYQLTVAFAINAVINSALKEPYPTGGDARNIDVNLPPGIVGNPLAVPQCPRAAFITGVGACPPDTQIGSDFTSVSLSSSFYLPIFNLVPPRGIPAQFGFTLEGLNVFIDAGVRSGGDNGITVHTDNLPEIAILENNATIWGTPADPSHDYLRSSEVEGCISGCADPLPLTPFLTVPTSCQGQQTTTGQILGTWEDESLVSPLATDVTQTSAGVPVGFTGCERLQHFEPSVSISPDTTYADTPAGLSVRVQLPQGLNPEGLATSGLKNTTVVLPEGIAINPGQATGLVACQPSQEALGEANEGPTSCPQASKVGSDEITTPLLSHPLKGDIYILGSNPPNLQLLMTASGSGVNLKLVGTVHLNEQTGQLTTTFEKTPDLPFTEFTLSFSGGAQAALATPLRCGTYASSADFTPWSTPAVADAFPTSQFAINAGPGGAPCPSGALPFSPSMTAGATTDQAGGYTSFTMLLQRGHGQQRIKT
ncbi:MAG: hypothetical protein ACRDV0_10560, partial [Acidimicrobiales bacterium]